MKTVKMPPDSVRLVVTSVPMFKDPANLSVSAPLRVPWNLKLQARTHISPFDLGLSEFSIEIIHTEDVLLYFSLCPSFLGAGISLDFFGCQAFCPHSHRVGISDDAGDGCVSCVTRDRNRARVERAAAVFL